jgi:RNA polymerase sigma-70 factor (ECF subfamily)
MGGSDRTGSLRPFSNVPAGLSVQGCGTEEDLGTGWTAAGNPLLRLDFPEEASLAGQDEVVPATEPAVVESCRRGDLSAFEELFRSHGARMKSVAFNILGNTSDAEDAVQEAFLRVYRGLGAFKGQARLGTWIFRILVNACHDIGRQRRRRRDETELPGEDQLGAGTTAAGDAALRLSLEKAVARLRPRQRDVFLLFEVEGFLHREIAEILEIPEGTSKALLFEARRELRSALGAGRDA